MTDRARARDRYVEPQHGAVMHDRRTTKRGQGVTRKHVIAVLACLFGGAIVVNAVALQNEKHPAPMFRTVAKTQDTRTAEAFPVPPARQDANAAARSAPVATGPAKVAAPDKTRPPAGALETGDTLLGSIQQELAKRGYYKGDADGRPGPMTVQAIRDFQFAQRIPVDGKPSEALLKDVIAAKVTMKEELLDLVKRAGVDDKSTRTVADIQRALNKAGYGPLTEDGQMGPTTRSALAKFETDKKLPPRGEPKGPVLRVLASASGVPITQ